jgi:hypothetical protein
MMIFALRSARFWSRIVFEEYYGHIPEPGIKRRVCEMWSGSAAALSAYSPSAAAQFFEGQRISE